MTDDIKGGVTVTFKTSRRRDPPPSPIADPRAFALVLADWMDRYGYPSATAAAADLPVSDVTVSKWLRGIGGTHELAYRCLLDAIDEGRLTVEQIRERRNRGQ